VTLIAVQRGTRQVLHWYRDRLLFLRLLHKRHLLYATIICGKCPASTFSLITSIMPSGFHTARPGGSTFQLVGPNQSEGLGDFHPPAGSRGRAPVEVCGRSPQKPDAYTMCSGQTHFLDVFIEDIRYTFRLMQSLLPLTPTPPKKLRICENLTTHRGRGRVSTCPHVPHHGYATALQMGR